MVLFFPAPFRVTRGIPSRESGRSNTNVPSGISMTEPGVASSNCSWMRLYICVSTRDGAESEEELVQAVRANILMPHKKAGFMSR